MNTPKIRCKCDKCGRTQLVKVQELAIGRPKCYSGLNAITPKEPCLGSMSYCAEDYDDTILNASAMLAYLSSLPFNSKIGEWLDIVSDDLAHLTESNETPQEMGWAGQNGQP